MGGSGAQSLCVHGDGGGHRFYFSLDGLVLIYITVICINFVGTFLCYTFPCRNIFIHVNAHRIFIV